MAFTFVRDGWGVWSRVNQAYEYLKDRKPKARTVVGIVDGGVDVTHEDLKDVLC